MDEDGGTPDDWRHIFDQSDDDLQTFLVDRESFVADRLDHFCQGLTDTTVGPDLTKEFGIVEQLMRRVLPLFARAYSAKVSKIAPFLRNLLTSVYKLLGLVLNSLTRKAKESGNGNLPVDDIKADLQLGIVLVELTRDSLECRKEFPQSDSLSMVMIEKIPQILELSFQHCQNSRSIYGESLTSHFGSEVKNLFMKSKFAISTFLEFVEAGQEKFEWTKIDQFLQNLDRLQPILVELDFQTFGQVCKTYVKVCKHHWPALWELQYNALPHLIFVVKECEISVHDFKKHLKEGEETVLKRDGNVLAFLLKTVRQQSQVIQNSLTDKSVFYEILIRLMATLSTIDDLTTSAPSVINYTNFPKLTTEIPNMIYSFGIQLAEDPDLADYALKMGPEQIKKVGKGAAIYWAKIIADMWNPKHSDLPRIWFNEEQNLFQLLVDTIGLSHEILCESPILPGVQFNGKPLSPFTAYEFILTRTQSFIAVLLPEYLHFVESSLLQTVLKRNVSYWEGQFCLDVWAFLARYGPRELCFSYVKVLVDAYMSLKPNFSEIPPPFLETGIQRLFAFLCPEDINTFKAAYSISDDEQNLHLWKLVRCQTFVENNIEASNLQQTSLRLFGQLVEGNFTSESFPLCVAALVLLSEQWDILPSVSRTSVVDHLGDLFSKIDLEEETINKDLFVGLMRPLLDLTSKVYLAEDEDGSILHSVCQIGGMFPGSYCHEQCCHLLAYKADKISNVQLMELFTTLNNRVDLKNPNLPHVLIPVMKCLSLNLPDEQKFSTMDNYFARLNFHDGNNCQRKTPNSIETFRSVKKRKLVETDNEPTDRKAKLVKAFLTIRNELEQKHLSPSHKTSCLSALDTLEKIL